MIQIAEDFANRKSLLSGSQRGYSRCLWELTEQGDQVAQFSAVIPNKIEIYPNIKIHAVYLVPYICTALAHYIRIVYAGH